MNIVLEPEVILEIKNGHKIDAIKKIREKHGISLKEAKELVDQYCIEHKFTPPAVQNVHSWNSLILFFILSLLGYFLYQYFIT